MKYTMFLGLVLLSISSANAQTPNTACHPIVELEDAFKKVFPDVQQFILDKDQTAAYLGKYNLLGDFTHYYGEKMLINVLRSGTVLAVIVGEHGTCQRVQISGYTHKRILTLIKKGKKGKPT